MLDVTEDKAPLAEHLLSLDPESRYQRFMMPASDEAVLNYCEGSAPLFIVTAFEGDEVMGVAEAQRVGDDGLEVALSVRRDKRGMGYGGQMFEAVIREARARGYGKVTAYFSRENRAVARLCARHKARMSSSGPEVVAEITLPPSRRH